MIAMFEYTAEEVDLFYSVVEEAVKNRKPMEMYKIDTIIRESDFFLFGRGVNGLLFTFNGLKWVEDGRIYRCLIQPQIRENELLPVWIPVISVDDRTFSSSGDLSMIKKENRYLDTSRKWSNKRG